MATGQSDDSSSIWLLLSALLALASVAVLGYLVRPGATWPGDLTLLVAWQAHREAWLFATMVAVSWPGFFLPFAPLVLVVVLALGRWRARTEAVVLFVATAVAYVLAYLIKAVVARPRPTGPEVFVFGQLDVYGFPSQHCSSYVAFYGLLVYLAVVFWPVGVWRSLAMAVGGLLVLLVGLSRVYLGAHWPSDVLAGYLLGYSVWAVAVVYLRRSEGTRDRAAVARTGKQ